MSSWVVWTARRSAPRVTACDLRYYRKLLSARGLRYIDDRAPEPVWDWNPECFKRHAYVPGGNKETLYEPSARRE